MNLTPLEFIQAIKDGKKEFDLNRTESLYVDPKEFKKLTSKAYGHTKKSAIEHLTTDWSNGYTICSNCGSSSQLGKGFTKHISKGCFNCEDGHRTYNVNASPPKYGGFPARTMCVAFDDGMSYTQSKIELNKYSEQCPILKP